MYRKASFVMLSSTSMSMSTARESKSSLHIIARVGPERVPHAPVLVRGVVPRKVTTFVLFPPPSGRSVNPEQRRISLRLKFCLAVT